MTNKYNISEDTLKRIINMLNANTCHTLDVYSAFWASVVCGLESDGVIRRSCNDNAYVELVKDTK